MLLMVFDFEDLVGGILGIREGVVLLGDPRLNDHLHLLVGFVLLLLMGILICMVLLLGRRLLKARCCDDTALHDRLLVLRRHLWE